MQIQVAVPAPQPVVHATTYQQPYQTHSGNMMYNNAMGGGKYKAGGKGYKAVGQYTIV